MPIISQNAEVDAVFEMAQKLARRTYTHFVVDPAKRESFVAFGEAVAAYSCANALGVWHEPPKPPDGGANIAAVVEKPSLG